MRRTLRRLWLGIGLVGVASLAGCSHNCGSCDCCCETCTVYPAQPAPAVVALPPAPPHAPVAVAPSLPDANLQPTSAKKVDLTPKAVLATVVAPTADGSVTGTMALTAAEAEAMGIRPGYTPGALYAPDSAPRTLQLTGAKESQEKEKDPSAEPAVARPDEQE
jgi:hypothetical protein